MNPGSSKPLEKTSNLKTSVESISEKLVKNRLVIARPDKTQYQIMRVMIARDWKHARIIKMHLTGWSIPDRLKVVNFHPAAMVKFRPALTKLISQTWFI